MEIGEYQRVIPDAYHGTDRRNAAGIMRSDFKISHSERNHLGTGVYFYDGSMAYAKEWARRKVGPQGEIAVIRATISMGRCLDLQDRGVEELVRVTIEGFRESGWKYVPLPVIVNHLAERHDIETVRAVQTNLASGRIDKDQPYYWVTRIVICVRRLENIGERQLVYQDT